MELIELAGTGKRTSRLGFCCSNLMGATGRRRSLALLQTAYDAGIRHFDVAPMYGFGDAESCLGEFLAQGHKDVTVTTKFGIAPARNRRLMSMARHAAQPILAMLPFLKKGLVKTANTVASTGARVPFTAAEARRSLERSLRALRTDYIDVFLLHEVTAQDLEDSELLNFLEQAKQNGTIGVYGVGSEAKDIQPLATQRPEYCRVLQHEWSIRQKGTSLAGAFRIYHRILTASIGKLHERLAGDRHLIAELLDGAGIDIRERQVFAALLIKAVLESSAGSIVLFSSKNPEHIYNNVRVASDSGLVETALALFKKLSGEGVWCNKDPVSGSL